MADVQHHRLRRCLAPLIGLALLTTLWVAFPPFHVRHLAAHPAAPGGSQIRGQTAFDARRYAQSFWREKLLTQADRAVDAATIAAALARDSELAARQYGHRIGLGASAYYYVHGSGSVANVDHRGVWLKLDGYRQMPVLIPTGPIFSNALRDGTGSLDMATFSSFDFNALGVELNRLQEEQVQPGLKRASVGMRLHFLGCGEAVTDNGMPIFKVIPITVEFSS
jgi:hypothetical protein